MTYLTTFLTCREWAGRERGYWWKKVTEKEDKVSLADGVRFLFLRSREEVVRKGPDRDLTSCGVKEVPFNLRRLVYKKEKATG